MLLLTLIVVSSITINAILQSYDALADLGGVDETIESLTRPILIENIIRSIGEV